MDTDAQIQEVTPAWSEALAAIHAAAFPPAEVWASGAFREQLAVPGSLGLVHGAGGMILVRSALDEAEILTLAVTPDSRRRGIGLQLLRAATERLERKGVRTLFLEVRVGNTAAASLYEKAGFIDVGRRRGYYPDGSDARILRLSLEQMP